MTLDNFTIISGRSRSDVNMYKTDRGRSATAWRPGLPGRSFRVRTPPRGSVRVRSTG